MYRALKEDDRLKKIPVIIITGISDDFRKFISTRRQVPPPDGYPRKPFVVEEVLETVRRILGQDETTTH